MRKRMNRRNGGYVGDWRMQDQSGTITPDTQTTLINKTKEWMRPSYWLPMPGMTEGQTQEFAGLFAIFRGASGFTGSSGDSNFVAFRVQGNYIVDWGVTTAAQPQGVTSAYASNATAVYNYNWNDVPAATVTPEGYKQVLIRVTPQPGSTLSLLDLSNQRYAVAPVSLIASNAVPWLSIKICAPSLSTFAIGDSAQQNFTTFLDEIEIVGSISDPTITFANVNGLQAIKGTKFTKDVTSVDFNNVPLMRRLPLIDSRKLSNFTNFFNACTNLEIIPDLHTGGESGVLPSTFSSAFANTSVVIAPPWFKLGNTADIAPVGMYTFCRRLKRVDRLNLSNPPSGNVRDMFNGCYSLVRLPDRLDSGVLINSSTMFSDCSSLEKVPAGLCYAHINAATSMFANMSRCSVFPTDVIGSGLTATGLTANSFGSVALCGMVAPRLNWSKINTVVQAYRLSSFPEIVGGVMTAGWQPANGGQGACMGWGTPNRFNSEMPALKIFPKLQGLLQNTDMRSNLASPTELDTFFNGLGTTTAGVLNVSTNWGITGASFGIATGKGWTFTNV